MIDVCFNPSIEGSLKACRGYGLMDDIEFVVDLNCMMDCGFIAEGIDSDYRITLPDKLYLFGYHGDDITSEDYRSTGERNLKYWQALEAFLQKEIPVRVWYSDSPQEYCGLLHLSTLLEKYNSKVTLVKCPEIYQGEKSWFFIHGWGQLDSAKIKDNMQYSHVASREEISVYAERWRELQEENTLLRTVISGQAISVAEDFYDFLIRREFPLKSVRQASVIGEVMGKSGIGVYGFVYEIRIQKMIDTGEIIVEQPAERDNDRIISTI